MYRHDVEWAYQRIDELEGMYRAEIRRGDRLSAKYTDAHRRLWTENTWGLVVYLVTLFALLLTVYNTELYIEAAVYRSDADRVCGAAYAHSIEVYKAGSIPELNP